jgi:hypothetical protein
VVRMVVATELPWLPVAPKTAMVDLDILEGFVGGCLGRDSKVDDGWKY